MGIYRVQHCFRGPGVDASDQYCNTFHLRRVTEATPIDWLAPFGGVGAGIGSRVAGYIHDFYQDWMQDFGSSVVQWPGETTKIFRLADTPPRAAVYVTTNPEEPIMEYDPEPDPLVTGMGYMANLPNECACCLSYEAITGEGVRARRRGRLYLGPLNISIAQQAAKSEPRIYEGAREVITTAFNAMTVLLDLLDLEVGVYSPTDAAFHPWQTCWVDNAFDTQRRRGSDPTTRTIFERS